jgi:hypothetical protein
MKEFPAGCKNETSSLLDEFNAAENPSHGSGLIHQRATTFLS